MVTIATGITSGIYKFFLVVHILSVVVGIGAVMLNGIYAAQAQKRLADGNGGGRAVSEANFFVSNVAEKVIYTIPIWGILLVILSDKAWKFSQTWIWLALLLYVVAIGISHAIMIPGHKRINELMAEMEAAPPAAGGVGAPPQATEAQQIGQRLAAGGMALNLIVVVIIALMVWKPGV
jgi:uncharacterized membrane protein